MRTEYEYPDDFGVVRFKVVRTDFPDREIGKTFAQAHRASEQDKWVWRAPPWPVPVYGADIVAALPTGSPVLVVSGEKTALAARKLFGGKIAVVTWSGGDRAVKKTFWDDLRRHRVAILGDLDHKAYPPGHARAGQIMPFSEQSGQKAAKEAAQASGGTVVELPQEFIDAACQIKDSGWDLADELPPGYSVADVAGWIRAALQPKAQVEPRDPTYLVPSGNGHDTAADALVPEQIDPPRPAEVVVPRVNHLSEPPLIRTRQGPSRCFENVRRILVENVKAFRLRYDTFANRAVVAPRPGQTGDPIPVTDAVLFKIASIMETMLNGSIHRDVVRAAIDAAARKDEFNPVHEYLDGLKWEGSHLTEEWLIKTCGVENNPLNRAFSQRWLIQAVARARVPGAKADAMIVLEGAQGKKKSMLLETLFSEKWFSRRLPNLDSKDAMIQLAGKWCIEIAEMDAFSRTEASRIKAFLTDPVDRFRQPHGIYAEDFKRSCVFAGSINQSYGYLKDPTGGRRFWPLKVDPKMFEGKKANVDWLVENRDQLWAEADALYKQNVAWWLHEESLEEAAREVQEDRRDEDVWEPDVAEFVSGRSRVTVRDVLSHLSISRADRKPLDAKRVGEILTAFGWPKTRPAIAGKGPRPSYYVNPNFTAKDSTDETDF